MEAYNFQVSQQKLQVKAGTHNQYRAQFSDMFRRGVLVEITKEDMDLYKEPVNYITHHKVLKPGLVLLLLGWCQRVRSRTAKPL